MLIDRAAESPLTQYTGYNNYVFYKYTWKAFEWGDKVVGKYFMVYGFLSFMVLNEMNVCKRSYSMFWSSPFSYLMWFMLGLEQVFEMML